MQTNRHESICHLIDKSLAGECSVQDEHSLREHLSACASCQQYLETSRRAIAGLAEFTFDTNPDLPEKIFAALTARAAQLEAHRLSHRKLAWSYVAALVLTIAGSFVAMQMSGSLAAIFSASQQQTQLGLIALWIVPSMCFCLLLPTLPMMSKRWMHAKGASL